MNSNYCYLNCESIPMLMHYTELWRWWSPSQTKTMSRCIYFHPTGSRSLLSSGHKHTSSVLMYDGPLWTVRWYHLPAMECPLYWLWCCFPTLGTLITEAAHTGVTPSLWQSYNNNSYLIKREALPLKYLAIWCLKDKTINETEKVVMGEELSHLHFIGSLVSVCIPS